MGTCSVAKTCRFTVWVQVKPTMGAGFVGTVMHSAWVWGWIFEFLLFYFFHFFCLFVMTVVLFHLFSTLLRFPFVLSCSVAHFLRFCCAFPHLCLSLQRL